MEKLRVLICCEESQAECKAFRELGHEAYSCDIQPVRPGGNIQWHIISDARKLLHGQKRFYTQDNIQHVIPGWDLIISHPPCTYLCKVGAVHMWRDGQIVQERYDEMIKAREFFLECYNTDAAYYIAVENPLPMALAKLPKPSCFIHPSWFGVKYTKKTLYWTKNLPPIMSQLIFPNAQSFVHASRGKYRSRTFPQVAKALALQWSNYIQYDKSRRHCEGKAVQ